MLFETLLASIILILLVIASYIDLKTREVPDLLSYGLVVIALGVRGIFAVQQGFALFLSGLLGFAICFVLAWVFYLSRQWGGGDSKLLMGMGAAIGVALPFGGKSFTLLWFFLLLLLAGALYGLVWLFIAALRRWPAFSSQFRQRMRTYRKVHYSLLSVTLLLALGTAFLPLLWLFLLLPLPFFYLFIFVNITEDICFLKYVSPSRLTEGDWLAEDVTVADAIIMREKTLEKKDVERLQKFHAQHQLPVVLIREGIPFVPSFFAAYLLIIFGLDKILATLSTLIG